MKAMFVDTAGWVAAADASDPAFRQVCEARDLWLEEGGLLVTTDYVCDETLTLLRMKLGLEAAETWWRQLESSSRLKFEAINYERAERARALFFRHKDKTYSFTDCTSFVVMKELNMHKSLTLDNHFRQMGFEVLPLS